MDSKDVRRLRDLMLRDFRQIMDNLESYGLYAIKGMFSVLDELGGDFNEVDARLIIETDQGMYRFQDAMSGLEEFRRQLRRVHREVTLSVGRPTSPEMLEALDEADKNVAEGRR